MKNMPKLSINYIIGILVGIGAVALILNGSNMLISFVASKEINVPYGVISYSSILLSILTFIFIVRRFVRLKSKKLALYFILSLVSAGGGALFTWFMIFFIASKFLSSVEVQNYLTSQKGMLIIVSSTYLIFIFVLLIFILIFILLINRKIKYITYISHEVKRIEEEGFGLRIQERGNDELTELSIGINAMSTKLKEKIEYEKKLEKDKNDLITNVSHDLRTPLTSIIGYVNLLKQNGFQEKEKFDEYIEVVERRIIGLNAMINELFEYTKLNSSEQTLNLNRTDFIPFIEHLLSEYAIIFQNQGLVLNTTIEVQSCMVNIDRNKVIRVFQNLLDNARKYAKRNTNVLVRVYAKTEWIYFIIENELQNDTKIKPERLFERFYKADTARSEIGSSGLGLAIVKRIMELHGGELIANMEDEKIKLVVKLKISDES